MKVRDFLLKTKELKTLYYDHAAKIPIIDYYSHICFMEIYGDKQYGTITRMWLGD